MHITRIRYDNFKGVTGEFDLEKLNLLVGPNGAGKTARLLGPQFAIMGSTPLGERPEATMLLAGPRGCAVGVTLDDGWSWTRRVEKDPREKTVSTIIEIPGREKLKLCDAEPIVHERVGNFAPMFDLNRFLDLSDDKRRAFVLQLCAKAQQGSGMTGHEFCQPIALEAFRREIGEGTVELALKQRTTMGAALDILQRQVSANFYGSLKTILEKITDELDPANVDATGIAAALDKANELKNGSKRTHEQAVQAGRRLAEQKQGIEVVAGSVQALQEECAGFDAERQELQTQLDRQSGRDEARRSKEADITRLAAKIDHIKEQIAELDAAPIPNLTEIADIEAKADELEKAPREPQSPIAELEQQLEALRVKRDKASADALRQQEVVHQASWKADQAKAKLKAAQESDWRRAVELAEAFSLEMAVIRGSDFPQDSLIWRAWKELTAFLVEKADEAGDPVSLAGLVQILENGSANEKAKLAECNHGRQALIAGYDGLAEELSRVRKEYGEACLARGKAQEEIRRLRGMAEGQRRSLAERETRMTALTTSLEERTQERITAEGSLNELLAEGHVPEAQLREQIEAIRTRQETLRQQIKDRERYATLEEQLTEVIASAEREEVYHEVCKLVERAIKVERERLMDTLVRPLLNRMNHFLSLAVPGYEAYCKLLSDRGKPIFQLGWVVDGTVEIPQPALSGGETAIFSAALAYALVMLADPPLKLLMLEAAELDVEHLNKLLGALGGVQEDLSNVLVATSSARADYSYPGWRVTVMTLAPQETVNV